MTLLPSFTPGWQALIVGAGGGIGGALADRLAADPAAGGVTRLTRADLDITDAAAIAALEVPQPPDLVIIATGRLHGDGLAPEKALRDLDAAALARSFAVNAVGPALLAQRLLPLLPKGRKTVFAALSARVGSISDNRLGGWHGYRASKAALNQLIRTMAVEQARRNPDSILLALHPGTVDTALSAPFNRGVPRLSTPDEAADHLLAVIDRATPASSGRLFDWQGLEIAP